jgi:3-hydroxyacyl-CoA dehydrogenase
MWASTGSPVNLYDISPSALKSATVYVADTLSNYCSEQGTHPGHVRFTTDLVDAVSNSWMVIEAVPEEIEVKISVLGRIDRSAPKDAIIATNSSSFKSRELVSEVKGRERVLNTLYYIPPGNKCVELMSCGYTSPSVFPFIVANMREVGLMPMVVGNESTGMIFPRIWAAMKRETLRELQEGVASAEEVDELFRDFFGAEKGICEKMDEVGLDTVVKVERKFLEDKETRDETRLWREHKHLNWLEREFVEKGRLGDKSGGGLLARNEEVVEQEKKKEEKKIQDLDDELPAQKTWQIHAVDLSGL